MIKILKRQRFRNGSRCLSFFDNTKLKKVNTVFAITIVEVLLLSMFKRVEFKMKNRIIRYFAVIIAVVTLLTSNSVMFAADINNAETMAQGGVMPCLDQCIECSFGFCIDGNGLAYATISYSAKPNFTEGTFTVKIQKKFLGIFWRTVDIGYYNNEWLGYTYDLDNTITNTFQLSERGTYRAVFRFEMEGSVGDTDIIEDEVQATY